jgi:hypothetical protein
LLLAAASESVNLTSCQEASNPCPCTEILFPGGSHAPSRHKAFLSHWTPGSSSILVQGEEAKHLLRSLLGPLATKIREPMPPSLGSLWARRVGREHQGLRATIPGLCWSSNLTLRPEHSGSGRWSRFKVAVTMCFRAQGHHLQCPSCPVTFFDYPPSSFSLISLPGKRLHRMQKGCSPHLKHSWFPI